MSLSNNTEFRDRVQNWVEEIGAKRNYHSLRLPDGQIIDGVVGIEALEARLTALGLPTSLTGKQALDVGSASGWNSFELERRGATVTAVDVVPFDELPAFKGLTNSHVTYRIMDVSDISTERLGRFDIVICLGVLYHLRHPLLALENLCAVTRDTAYIESYVTDSADQPSASVSLEFYEIDELGGQVDNWFGPTTACMLALCRSAGFASVELRYSQGGRAGVVCRRQLPPEPEVPVRPSPLLISVVNNRTNKDTFHRNTDEYLCIYFRHPGALTKTDLLIEIAGLGQPILTLHENGPGEWQANCRLPVGLDTGLFPVLIRLTDSQFSSPYAITIHEPESIDFDAAFEPEATPILPAPTIYDHKNSRDGSIIFQGFKSERLSLFFNTEDTHLTRSTIEVTCSGTPLAIDIVIPHSNQRWQVNAQLPELLPPGQHPIVVRTTRTPLSNPVPINYKSDMPS